MNTLFEELLLVIVDCCDIHTQLVFSQVCKETRKFKPSIFNYKIPFVFIEGKLVLTPKLISVISNNEAIKYYKCFDKPSLYLQWLNHESKSSSTRVTHNDLFWANRNRDNEFMYWYNCQDMEEILEMSSETEIQKFIDDFEHYYNYKFKAFSKLALFDFDTILYSDHLDEFNPKRVLAAAINKTDTSYIDSFRNSSSYYDYLENNHGHLEEDLREEELVVDLYITCEDFLTSYYFDGFQDFNVNDERIYDFWKLVDAIIVYVNRTL